MHFRTINNRHSTVPRMSYLRWSETDLWIRAAPSSLPTATTRPTTTEISLLWEGRGYSYLCQVRTWRHPVLSRLEAPPTFLSPLSNPSGLERPDTVGYGGYGNHNTIVMTHKISEQALLYFAHFITLHSTGETSNSRFATEYQQPAITLYSMSLTHWKWEQMPLSLLDHCYWNNSTQDYDSSFRHHLHNPWNINSSCSN